MNSKTYQQRADHLAALMEERLGIRGNGLRAKLRRAGRLLPSDMRRQAGILLTALDVQNHPKLARQMDERAIDAACRAIEDHLSAINPTERRIDRVIDILSSAALVLLVTAGLVVTVLVWRGFV